MIEELQQDIREVKEKIKNVEGDIEDLKKKLKENENILNETRAQLREATDEKEKELLEKERERLEKEKDHLEKEKELLREEKKLLNEKENLYLKVLHDLNKKEERLEQQQQATDNEAALVNQIQVPERYASLYEQLKKGKLTNNGCLIEWAEPIVLFKNMTKLYVRDCYVHLYQLITEANGRDSMVTNFVVTGVPGIGKSTFKIYFAWRCSQKNEGFLLEQAAGHIWFLHPKLPCQELSRTQAQQATYKDFPYFVDFKEKTEPGDDIGKYGVVFSSPNEDRYKQFANEPMYSRKILMNTWSDDELFRAAALLQIPLPDKTLEENFLKVGGVPRIVFNVVIDNITLTPDGYLDEALSKKGSLVARNFHENGFGTIDAQESYALVHINPPKKNDGSYDYGGKKVYSFASNYVSQRLFNLYYETVIASARNLFNFNSNLSNQPETGWKFERCCLFLTPIYASEKALSLQRLSHCRASAGSSSTSRENPNNVQLSVPKKMNILTLNGWRSNKKLEQGVFYIPSVSNFESADAFFVQDGILNVLQITVGGAHPVKANGLENIYALFFSDDEESVAASGKKRKRNASSTRSSSGNNARLIFVIPVAGLLSSSQPLTAKRGGRLKKLSETARKFNENQWLLRYEI